MVENYPRRIDRLPVNMTIVQSRAKDIMFCDKTSSLIKLSKLITKQVDLIELLVRSTKQMRALTPPKGGNGQYRKRLWVISQKIWS